MNAETDGLPPIIESFPLDSILAAKRRQFMSQPSTVATRRQQAVCVRRAHKTYGPKNNPNIVLDGLNMTVPKGTIYGLLGASGCGKTTLLSCIVGRRRLNAGEIWVLGGQPGSRGSGVPGPRIGYMPQEVALYGEFTIRETLLYFGWLAGMKTHQIDERVELMINLLQLPHNNQFVKHLSGGQQRRMSLAAALVHDPELLILDEPTVGVDPVLRQCIWDYMVDLTSSGHKTVIITTHYIEETRQAHLIGLMRGGKFLAEESPSFLIQKYNCESLEDVFLKLAVIQNKGKRRRSSIVQEVSENVMNPAATNEGLDMTDEDKGEISGEFGDNISMTSGSRASISSPPLTAPPIPPEEEAPETKFKLFEAHHMKALIWKNFLWMWRNVAVMLFIIGLPVAQIVLFCLAIGHDPTGLHLAITNHELTSDLINEQKCPVYPGCNYTLLSCRYLGYLKNRSVILKHYETDDESLEQVRKGFAWGAMVFDSNYSDALINRTQSGQSATEATITAAEVNVSLDMSNQQIGTLLFRDISYSFADFIHDILTDCEINPAVGKVPIRWETPIYGENDPNFTDFAAPGIILTIVFFLAVALTSGAMLIEKNEGMLERCLVSGISAVEILFSHVITQFSIMAFQAILVLIFCFVIFNLTIKGAVISVVVLTVLTGLCGMCFGFVISSTVSSERNATYIGMGSFLPIVMLCGIIWPTEGMYPGLKYFSYFLPLTQCTESLRDILQKGWTITNLNVQLGFMGIIIWIIIFLSISVLVLKFKKG